MNSPDETGYARRTRKGSDNEAHHGNGASRRLSCRIGAALLAGKDDIRKFHRMRSM